jgi:hypothetical protein
MIPVKPSDFAQPAEQNCTERMIPVKPSDFAQPAEQNCTERMIPVKPSDFAQPAEQNCTEVGGIIKKNINFTSNNSNEPTTLS